MEGADLRQTDLSEAKLKVSREQLATAYYVKEKPPDLQLIGMDNDMSETLSKMARKNRTERDHQVNEEKICDKPLAALVKSDTHFLDGWVAHAKTQVEKPNSLAEEMLEVAIKVDPNHFGAVFQLGRLWHIQAAKDKTLYQKAIEQYQKAIEIAENAKADGTRKEQLAQVYYNLGPAYMKKGEYDNAIDVLMKWQRLFDISDDKVLTNLGISHLNKEPSDKDRARYFLEQAIDMNPNNDLAKKVVKTLEMRLGR